jgi:hypothetical protein
MNDNTDDGPDASGLAAAIKDDFQLLVDALIEEIERLDDPESEILAALWKAKFIAERGLRLSKQLSQSIAGEPRDG